MAAALIAALVLLSAGAAQAAIVIGGATSVAPYVAQAILNAPNRANYGTYKSVGSGAGISNFISKTYQVAYSDVAIPSSQDAAAGGTKKFTIPFSIATYSFCTKKASVKLTGAQVYKIYVAKTRVYWSTIKTGLYGQVTPVARSDSSGSTEVIGKWIKTQNTAWPTAATGTNTWKGIAGVSPFIVYASGSAGIIAALKADVNRIGYVQTGICTVEAVPAAGIKNPAGNYIYAASGADLSASLPTTPPDYASTVFAGLSLLNRPGPSTYPIAALPFEFCRISYGSASVSYIVKTWIIYTMGSSVQGLAGKFYFDPLPQKYRDQGIKYGNYIKN